MTRIDFVRIENLAGRRREVSFELNPDVNVFWGLNGCGKTSLLRIMHGALDATGSGLSSVPFRSAELKVYSHNRGTHLSRFIDKDRPDETTIIEDDEGRLVEVLDSSKPNNSWITTPRDAPKGRLLHGYLPISRLASRTAARYRPSEVQDQEAAFDEAFGHAIQNLWIRVTNSSLVEQAQVQRRGMADVLRAGFIGSRGTTVPDHISSAEAYELTNEFLMSLGSGPRLNRRAFVKRYESDPAQADMLGSILKLNADMAAAREPIDKLVALIEDMLSGDKRVERTPHSLEIKTANGERIPLSGLSSGEKQLMYILLESMFAERNTLIIDEPELSMHPDWQEKLISAINTVNPHGQLIIATHSPEVMALVPDRCIFEL